MTAAEVVHRKLTPARGQAYADLFGDQPSAVFPAHQLWKVVDDEFLIDVFVYALEVAGRAEPVYAAVTNGMSDRRMAEGDDPDQPRRRELIQYFRACTQGHAQRLRDMAWAPLEDEFLLDSHHTMSWERPAVAGTPWKHALFLLPPFRAHREFAVEVEGDSVSFLWHIPLSQAEYAYRKAHGVNDLLDRMDEVQLPWVFDEENRPPMVS